MHRVGCVDNVKTCVDNKGREMVEAVVDELFVRQCGVDNRGVVN